MDGESLEKRLEMFEEQLRKMAEAVITLTRIEERQIQHNKEIGQLHNTQKEVSNEAFKRLRAIEANLSINTTKISISDKIWWTTITVILSTTLAYVLKYVLFNGAAIGP